MIIGVSDACDTTMIETSPRVASFHSPKSKKRTQTLNKKIEFGDYNVRSQTTRFLGNKKINENHIINTICGQGVEANKHKLTYR